MKGKNKKKKKGESKYIGQKKGCGQWEAGKMKKKKGERKIYWPKKGKRRAKSKNIGQKMMRALGGRENKR